MANSQYSFSAPRYKSSASFRPAEDSLRRFAKLLHVPAIRVIHKGVLLGQFPVPLSASRYKSSASFRPAERFTQEICQIVARPNHIRVIHKGVLFGRFPLPAPAGLPGTNPPLLSGLSKIYSEKRQIVARRSHIPAIHRGVLLGQFPVQLQRFPVQILRFFPACRKIHSGDLPNCCTSQPHPGHT